MNNILDFITANKLMLMVCHIIISIADIVIVIKMYRNYRKKINILKYHDMVNNYYADEVLRYCVLSILPIVNLTIFVGFIAKAIYVFFREIIKEILFRK